MTTKHYIENLSPHRLVVRSFRTSQAMHKFLNTGSNALDWKESERGLKPGTYAFAGGSWHNVKNMNAYELCHL